MKTFDENKPVTDAALTKGLADAVEVIEKYGDQYWPLFERLEREKKSREDKLSRLRQFKRHSKFH